MSSHIKNVLLSWPLDRELAGLSSVQCGIDGSRFLAIQDSSLLGDGDPKHADGENSDKSRGLVVT